MSENRTFAVVTCAAAGLFVGHFLVGADWFFAICLAVSFAGLVKGVLDNRLEDAVVNGCMIILFPLIAAFFPSLWAVCAKALAENGRTLDATEGRVIAFLLFAALYAVLHIVARMILSSVMIDEYPNRTPERARFPQPLHDGTWAPPIGDPNNATQIFYSQRPDVASNLRTRSVPDNDADAQFAKTIITENLPVVSVKGVRTVFLPDNHYMTEEEYIRRVEEQRSKLLAMPKGQRLRVLDIAYRIYGIKVIDDGNNINGETLPPVMTTEEVNEALKLSSDIQQYHN